MSLKKKSLFSIFFLLFTSCLNERGKAECCKNEILCYAELEGDFLGTLDGGPFDFHGVCCQPYVDAVQKCKDQYSGHPPDTYYFLPQVPGAGSSSCGQSSPCNLAPQKKTIPSQRKNAGPQIKNVPPQTKNVTPQKTGIPSQKKDMSPQIKGATPPLKSMPPQKKR